MMDNARSTALNVADLLAIARRRAKSLIFPLVAFVLLGVLVAFLAPAVYRSTATILIEEQEIPPEFVTVTVTSFAEQRIQQINQRIMSFPRLMEIIQRMGLYPELKDRLTSEEIVEQMRKDTELKPVSAEMIDRRTGRPSSATIAFTLSYQGSKPEKVLEVTNVLASLFLEENLRARTRQAAETTEFLEAETERVKQELSEIEARIAAFKKAHINALPELLQMNLQTLANLERGIETANGQLRTQRERESYLQAQLAGVRPYLEKEDEVSSKKRLEDLNVQLVALRQRFSDEHPDVKKIRAEIADLEKRLENIQGRGARGEPDNPAWITLSAQLAAVRAEIQGLIRHLEKLKIEANEYRARIAATPKVEEEYNGLLAVRSTTQAKASDLMRKLMEARVSHGLEKEQRGERFILVDPPRLPEKPHKPNRLAIVLIAIVFGIGAGVGFAALREFYDDSVHSVEQLAAATRYPVLAVIPRIEAPTNQSGLKTTDAALNLRAGASS